MVSKRHDVDLATLTANELLALHAQIGSELRTRKILRSSNNPTGDLAEYLFCKAFGWRQAKNSQASADASDDNGRLYQIKARRISLENPSRQLGALRGLSDGGFDYLGCILFNPDYTIRRAALIPHRLVLDNSKYVEHTNSWNFHLRDIVWTWPGVDDVTDRLLATQI